MILLLSVTEADCLDHQHRRITSAKKRQQRSRSDYRASGLVRRCFAVDGVAALVGWIRSVRPSLAILAAL
ncbi:hypothetical protein G7045_08600 [Acidovorax sp. HDW3]|uniref:hypothetical protein n=1 Tax=Acidovorax sp. HDW3 TaxID=2714923 RepID=UPI00140CE97D|nr:hypothetical protein [Acidovorax sp. HDW3]QIL44312.1 hypothetical protein G7045_08600 [Acidovorax sp. HDW3]